MVDNGWVRSGLRGLLALWVLAAPFLSLGLAPAAAASPTTAAGTDPGRSKQWGLDAIGAPDAWATATGRGTTIAVVDSGAALEHEDLQDGKIVGAPVSCLDTNGDAMKCVPGGQDDDGHGTHVAGIAAATTGNGKGIAGVAPDASLLIVKVLRHGCDALGSNCTASGTAADVAAGILYAADHGADIINLSLGNTTQSVLGASFSDALEYAWSKGAIPVVAAGNGYVLPSGFSNQHAVIVAALDRDDTRSHYSNDVGDAMWGISAPGGETDDDASCNASPNGILSTFWTSELPTNAYACLAGTSAAAPHVSGALAVLRSAGLTAQQAVDRMIATARDLGDPGRDQTFGSGALDLAAAVGPGMVPTTTTAGPQPAGTNPATDSTSTSSPSTSTDAPGATSSTPAPGVNVTPSSTPPLATIPSASSTTTQPAAAIGALTPNHDDDLPAGPVSAAALLAAGVGVASGWVLIRGASWARRTPF